MSWGWVFIVSEASGVLNACRLSVCASGYASSWRIFPSFSKLNRYAVPRLSSISKYFFSSSLVK